MPNQVLIAALSLYADLHGVDDSMDTQDDVAAGDVLVNRHTLNALLGMARLFAETADENDPGCGNCIGCAIWSQVQTTISRENRRLLS